MTAATTSSTAASDARSPAFPPSLAASPFWVLVGNDLHLAAQRRSEALLPLLFFVVAVGLFPLGVGPEPRMLRQIAPGVIWVCALLSTLLSVHQLYAVDHADGTLDQMLLSGQPPALIALARALSHWLLTGLPLVLCAPLFGLMFGVSAPGIRTLVLGLLIGTPALCLLSNVGAALTLGLRGGGLLVFLLVLPLAVPVLIFGTGAVTAVEAGLPAGPWLSLLGALAIATAVLAPLAGGAALRISTE